MNTPKRTSPHSFRSVALLVCLAANLAGPFAAAADGRRQGLIEPGKKDAEPALLRYYKAFVDDNDADVFVQNVLARYTESSLIRLVDSTDIDTRRAAVLSLGLIGGPAANSPVGERMKDDDSVVRAFAENALWGIWFRSDSVANNQELAAIRNLLGEDKVDQAYTRVNLLIEKAPKFAEAWNQRAIIHYTRGDWEKSAADCRKAIELNPYHYGAISGMAQCYIRADQPKQAIEAFRMLVRIQPHNSAAVAAIEALEQARPRP